jgi:methionyl-tRNA formyltransferase
MRDSAQIEAFAALDLDAAVVVAYGQILPGRCWTPPGWLLQPARQPASGWRGRRAYPARHHGRRRAHRRPGHAHDRGPGRGPGAPGRDRADRVRRHGGRAPRQAGAGRRRAPARALELLARGEAVETPQPDEGATYAARSSRTMRASTGAAPGRRWTARSADSRPSRRLVPVPAQAGGRGRARAGQGADEPGQPGRGRARRGAGGGSGGPAGRLPRRRRAPAQPAARRRGVQDAEAFLRGFPLAVGTVLA